MTQNGNYPKRIKASKISDLFETTLIPKSLCSNSQVMPSSGHLYEINRAIFNVPLLRTFLAGHHDLPALPLKIPH